LPIVVAGIAAGWVRPNNIIPQMVEDLSILWIGLGVGVGVQFVILRIGVHLGASARRVASI